MQLLCVYVYVCVSLIRLSGVRLFVPAPTHRQAKPGLALGQVESSTITNLLKLGAALNLNSFEGAIMKTNRTLEAAQIFCCIISRNCGLHKCQREREGGRERRSGSMSDSDGSMSACDGSMTAGGGCQQKL